jgi:hypothetical protein
VALSTITCRKAEKLVTFLAQTVTELVNQILVHKLNLVVAVGYEYAVHEVFKDDAQSIPLVPDSVVTRPGDLRHRFPRQPFKSLALKSEILSTKF